MIYRTKRDFHGSGEKLRFGRLLGVDCNLICIVSLVALVVKVLELFLGYRCYKKDFTKSFFIFFRILFKYEY